MDRVRDVDRTSHIKTPVARSKIVIDPDKCNLCGRCVEMCPFNAVEIKNKSIDIDREACNLCLCCMEACAGRAMDFKGLLAHTDVFLR